VFNATFNISCFVRSVIDRENLGPRKNLRDATILQQTSSHIILNHAYLVTAGNKYHLLQSRGQDTYHAVAFVI